MNRRLAMSIVIRSLPKGIAPGTRRALPPNATGGNIAYCQPFVRPVIDCLARDKSYRGCRQLTAYGCGGHAIELRARDGRLPPQAISAEAGSNWAATIHGGALYWTAL
jgi:hypothetical protein